MKTPYRWMFLVILLFQGCQTPNLDRAPNNPDRIPCKYVGTSVTPKNVTFGNTGRTCHPDWNGYPEKKSVSFEIRRGEPVFAITDMELKRVINRSSKVRVEQNMAPYDDLMLEFATENNSRFSYYHLSGSPLTPAYNSESCPIWETFETHRGYDLSPMDCGAEIGSKVKKGDLIGYSGRVGSNHDFFDIIFEPMIGGELRVVQGDAYFRWECGNEDPEKFRLPFRCD